MMTSWKHTFTLLKFEMFHAKKHFIIILGLLFLFLFLVVSMIPDYMETPTIGLDFFFLYGFTILTVLFRPKVFQSQKVNGRLWASHFIILLNHLPATKDVIIKYRFLSYIIINFIFHLLFLAVLYLVSSTLQESMSVSTYLVFSIFWLALNMYVGSYQAVSEVGANLFLNIIIAICIAPIILIVIIVLFYKWYENGLVHWTMFIAANHPFSTCIVSIILAFLGLNLWMKQMRRKMSKTDYL